MRMLFFILLALTPGGLGAQAVLEPPFGMKWGDSPEKLVDWARERRFDIRITIPGNAPEIREFHVAPELGTLPRTEATALEARFLEARLIEITVHYRYPDESFDVTEARFLKLKRRLTGEHGDFVANHSGREIDDDFVTRTRSFHREPVEGLFLLLASTEVEDLRRERKELTFSLIYRNDNLRRKIERERATRGGKADR
jgi:hypothetical protein